jgi:hypothetical protein
MLLALSILCVCSLFFLGLFRVDDWFETISLSSNRRRKWMIGQSRGQLIVLFANSAVQIQLFAISEIKSSMLTRCSGIKSIQPKFVSMKYRWESWIELNWILFLETRSWGIQMPLRIQGNHSWSLKTNHSKHNWISSRFPSLLCDHQKEAIGDGKCSAGFSVSVTASVS